MSHRIRTKFRKPLLPLGVALGLTVISLGLTAAPVNALTLRTLTNTSTGNILNSSGQVGNVVGAANPVPNGYIGSWYFQKFSGGSTDGEYEVHPSNNTSLCLTAETGAGQDEDKIETCDGGTKPPSNQLWVDTVISGSTYYLSSSQGGLSDPSSSHSNHAVINTLDGQNVDWVQS